MRRSGLLTIAVIVGLLFVGPVRGVGAGEISIIGAGGYFSIGVTSLKEARFRKVIQQQYDFSCGAAALATLLSYHYDTPITEREAVIAMYEVGDQEKIRNEGFSLFDIKGFLGSRGFRSNGYRATLDKLQEVGLPAIVLINTRGYLHFVVIKGVTSNEVLVGDPALGMKTHPRDEFQAIWANGILFVVEDKLEVGQEHFNDKREWRVRRKAPFGTALTRQGLASFTMQLPQSNEFNF